MQCYSRFIGEGVSISKCFVLPISRCRIMFKTYTVKPGNTAICKSVSDGVRKVV